MEEDDRSSVGTDQILGACLGERFDDGASATYTAAFSLPDDAAAKGEWKAAAAPAPADNGLKSALPIQPSCPTSVLALEAALLAKYAAPASAAAAVDDAAAASCDLRFMVDAEWLRQWKGYVLGQAGCLPPGPLTNLGLYDGRTLRLRQGLVQEVDYKALTPTAYHILAILYGTANDDAGGAGGAGGGSNAAMPPEICRFGPNIFNAEVPPSKLRDVTVEAKQRAHSEVNRLMARQRRQIIGGGASGSNAEDAMSIVSSCSSFHMAGRDGGAADDGGDGDEEREAASCCARWLYPLCFALIPASFHRYARDKIMTAGGQRRHGQRGRGTGEAAGEVGDVQSIISASFTLEMGEGEEEDDDLLLLWRSRPGRFGGRGGGSLGLVGLGRGGGGGSGFGATSTML